MFQTIDFNEKCVEFERIFFALDHLIEEMERIDKQESVIAPTQEEKNEFIDFMNSFYITLRDVRAALSIPYINVVKKGIAKL